MKRYGGLWDQVCSLENIVLAHRKAKRGKGHYKEVQMVEDDPERYFSKIKRMLEDRSYTVAPYRVMFRKEGRKVREIWKLPYYPDRIIHHCLMNVVEPIWKRELIRDTYAAIRGRGIHDGVRRIRKALDDDPDGTAYCLKMDVRKFYQNISPEVQKVAFRRKIKDHNVLWLLDCIADSAPGVPIGNYPSQPIGNLVLSPIDHWVKEVLGVRYYYRYCDDIVVFGADKVVLHAIRRDVDLALMNMGLTMKGNWQVFPVDVRGIDFLGYRFFRDYTLVRKSIVQAFKRKYRRRSESSISAYNGWFCWADTHNLRQKYKWRNTHGRIQFIGTRGNCCPSGRRAGTIQRAAG